CSHYSEQFTTPRHHGPTHSLVWCLGLAVAVYVANSAVDGEPAGSLLALAVLAGSLSHVLADGLTVAGVPLWWPSGVAAASSWAPWPSGPGAGPRSWSWGWRGRRGRLVGHRLTPGGFHRTAPANIVQVRS